MHCTTKYYASTTPTYYSMLQSTTPVLLCTTKYYSSTIRYYKVLRQYYSVLHSTTPVLLCTTKYYASTLYYKVLLQYYKVLRQYYSVRQSTTLVLLCTTRCGVPNLIRALSLFVKERVSKHLTSKERPGMLWHQFSHAVVSAFTGSTSRTYISGPIRPVDQATCSFPAGDLSQQ